MASLKIDGAVYEYSEPQWDKLLEGEYSAPETVLRAIIKRHRERILQLEDEVVYREELLAEAQPKKRAGKKK